MRAAWDVASVALACIHNWNPMGVKKAISPEDLHPLTAKKRAGELTKQAFDAAIGSLPKHTAKPGSFTVVPKQPKQASET